MIRFSGWTMAALIAVALAPMAQAKEPPAALAMKCRDQGGKACIELDNRCDKKEADACYDLGLVRVNQRDEAEAVRLFRAACRYGRKQVCEALESVRRDQERQAQVADQLEAQQRADATEYERFRLSQQIMMNNIEAQKRAQDAIIAPLQALSNTLNQGR